MAKRIAQGAGWSISVTNEGALTFLGKAPPKVTRQLGHAMRDIAADIPVEVKKRMDDYSAGNRSRSDPVMVRTGALWQSVRGKKAGTNINSLRALIMAGNANVPYAGIQEYGGTIRPKKPRGKLRMPLEDILTDRGDVKGEYEIVERANGYQTRGGKPTWISGRAIMIEENGIPRPIWALLSEAKIAPRLGMGTTIASSEEYIRDQLLAAVDRAVRK